LDCLSYRIVDMMDWQDYIVWGIGAIVLLIIARRLLGISKGKRKINCMGCSEAKCPYRQKSSQHK